MGDIYPINDMSTALVDTRAPGVRTHRFAKSVDEAGSGAEYLFELLARMDTSVRRQVADLLMGGSLVREVTVRILGDLTKRITFPFNAITARTLIRLVDDAAAAHPPNVRQALVAILYTVYRRAGLTVEEEPFVVRFTFHYTVEPTLERLVADAVRMSFEGRTIDALPSISNERGIFGHALMDDIQAFTIALAHPLRYASDIEEKLLIVLGSIRESILGMVRSEYREERAPFPALLRCATLVRMALRDSYAADFIYLQDWHDTRWAEACDHIWKVLGSERSAFRMITRTDFVGRYKLTRTYSNARRCYQYVHVGRNDSQDRGTKAFAGSVTPTEATDTAIVIPNTKLSQNLDSWEDAVIAAFDRDQWDVIESNFTSRQDALAVTTVMTAPVEELELLALFLSSSILATALTASATGPTSVEYIIDLDPLVAERHVLLGGANVLGGVATTYDVYDVFHFGRRPDTVGTHPFPVATDTIERVLVKQPTHVAIDNLPLLDIDRTENLEFGVVKTGVITRRRAEVTFEKAFSISRYAHGAYIFESPVAWATFDEVITRAIAMTMSMAQDALGRQAIGAAVAKVVLSMAEIPAVKQASFILLKDAGVIISDTADMDAVRTWGNALITVVTLLLKYIGHLSTVTVDSLGAVTEYADYIDPLVLSRLLYGKSEL